MHIKRKNEDDVYKVIKETSSDYCVKRVFFFFEYGIIVDKELLLWFDKSLCEVVSMGNNDE